MYHSSYFKISMAVIIVIHILMLSETTYCLEFPRESLLKNTAVQYKLNTLRINQNPINYYTDSNTDGSKFLRSVDFSLPGSPEKNPKTAFILAFFPGFFVHGLGHYYINENSTGTRLLIAEALSVFIFYYSLVGEVVSMENPDGENHNTDLARGISYVIFLGSWGYDFIGAPIKVRKMNEKYGLTVFPNYKNDRVSINIALSWN